MGINVADFAKVKHVALTQAAALALLEGVRPRAHQQACLGYLFAKPSRKNAATVVFTFRLMLSYIHNHVS